MKLFKNIFKIVLVLLVLLIVAMIAIPYFFEDDIVAKIKEEANKQTEATIDFDDVNLSLFRSFPNLNLSLDALSVTTPLDQRGQDFAQVDELSLVIDLASVLNSNAPLKIEKILVSNPELNVFVGPDGTANYSVFMSEESSDSEMIFDLNYYEISNGGLNYSDESQNTKLLLGDLNHSGSGSFSSKQFVFQTDTKIGEIDVANGGISYLSNAILDAAIDFDVNNETASYTLSKTDISLNDLKLLLSGKFQMEENSYEMDLKFDTPDNQFKDFLSIVPGAFTEDFADVRTEGSFKMNGFAKGRYYADRNIYPKFQLILEGKDAYFQYPDLPEKIENISFDIHIDNPTDDIKNSVLDIRAFHFEVQNNPFDLKLKMTDLLGNPTFDGAAKGRLDFEKLAKAYPMEGIKQLAGIANIDLAFGGNQRALTEQIQDQIRVDGQFDMANFQMIQDSFPKVSIDKFVSDINQNAATVNIQNMNIGRSDFTATGDIKNPLGLMMSSFPIDGNLTVSSRLVDMNEFFDPESETTAADTQAIYHVAYPLDKTKMNVSYTIDELKYSEYDLNKVSAKGMIQNNDFILESSSLQSKSSDLAATGKLENIWAYGLQGDTLGGSIKVTADKLVLDDFMTTVEGAEDDVAAQEVLLIPGNVDINVVANAKEVYYDKIELNNLNGSVKIANQVAKLDNMKADGLGGVINVTGAYDTQDEQEPKFDFSYNMSELKFTKMTESVPSFTMLAPIAKFIEGIFNSTLKLSGNLTPDLFPDFNTLTGSGFLETTQGKVKGYKPLEKINSLFNLADSKQWDIKDSRNWFEVKDGTVAVKEFDLAYQGVDFKVSGSHKINQDMDYLMKAKIPRKMLSGNKLGDVANQGLNTILGSVKKAGIDLGTAEFVDVHIMLTGNLLSPKIQIKPVGASGAGYTEEATAAVKELVADVKDSVTTVVKEETDKLKTKAEEKITEVTDSIETLANKKIEEAKVKVKEEVTTKAEEIAGEVGDTLVGEIGKKAEDLLGDKAKDVKDSAKDKLKGLFGKKKKGN